MAEAVIELTGLTPAAEEGWLHLFALTEENDHGWVLIGGQMTYLLALEHGTELPRPTVDMDVVVDVRTVPGGTRWLAGWLGVRGFEQAAPSADGISHRFVRAAQRGTVTFDVLAPEGLGPATDLTTVPPGRTVQAPGGTQALARSRIVEVAVRQPHGAVVRGRVRRPDLLGALVLKAAATSLAVRSDRERDWQDAALMLSMVPDPFELTEQLTAKDRSRLRRLNALHDREHQGWLLLGDDAYRRGTTTLAVLLE